MDGRVYRRILKRTVCNYHAYILKGLLKYLEEEKLIRYDGRSKENKEVLDVTSLGDDKTRMIEVFDKLSSVYKKCEEFEYMKAYRYCYLYKINNINYNKITEYVIKDKAIMFKNNKTLQDKISPIIQHPTIKEEDRKIYFKFSLKLDSKLAGKDAMKHIVLAIIHKDQNLLEIREDVIPTVYNALDNAYATYARSTKGFICEMLEADADNLDLQSIIRHMKNKKIDEVKVASVKLKRQGAEAVLDGSGNDEMELPILDELKSILKEEIFDSDDINIKNIKDRLELFIKEVEEVSDLPVAKIFFLHEKYTVEIFHGETESELGYLKWKGELKGKEGMDYVTEYIMQCERSIEEELGD